MIKQDQRKAAKRLRVYVNVTTVFDSVGCVTPQSIQWKDGRVFQISGVRDFRPAGTIANLTADCYTVLINGREKLLYFERVDTLYVGRIGRWYVEVG